MQPISYRILRPIFATVALILTIAAGVLFGLALTENTGGPDGYLAPAYRTVVPLVFVLGIALMALYIPLNAKEGVLLGEELAPLRLAALPISVMSFVWGFAMISHLTDIDAAAKQPVNRRVAVLFGVLLLVNAIYYLAVAAGKTPSVVRGVTGLFSIPAPITYAMCVYFNTTIPANAPIKICIVSAFMAVVLLLLIELRISLGKPLMRLTKSLCWMLSIVIGGSAIAGIVIAIRGEESPYPLYPFLYLFFSFLYIYIRALCIPPVDAEEVDGCQSPQECPAVCLRELPMTDIDISLSDEEETPHEGTYSETILLEEEDTETPPDDTTL